MRDTGTTKQLWGTGAPPKNYEGQGHHQKLWGTRAPPKNYEGHGNHQKTGVNQDACERYAVPVSFKRPVMLLIIKSSKNSLLFSGIILTSSLFSCIASVLPHSFLVVPVSLIVFGGARVPHSFLVVPLSLIDFGGALSLIVFWWPVMLLIIKSSKNSLLFSGIILTSSLFSCIASVLWYYLNFVFVLLHSLE
jgi:hypothetical protein